MAMPTCLNVQAFTNSRTQMVELVALGSLGSDRASQKRPAWNQRHFMVQKYP